MLGQSVGLLVELYRLAWSLYLVTTRQDQTYLVEFPLGVSKVLRVSCAVASAEENTRNSLIRGVRKTAGSWMTIRRKPIQNSRHTPVCRVYLLALVAGNFAGNEGRTIVLAFSGDNRCCFPGFCFQLSPRRSPRLDEALIHNTIGRRFSRRIRIILQNVPASLIIGYQQRMYQDRVNSLTGLIVIYLRDTTRSIGEFEE